MKGILKTQFAIVIISIILATKAYGQKGLYLNVGGGYGICIAANSGAASFSEIRRNGSNTYEISNGSGSFGKGVQFGATAGFMFSENIGAELNVGYLVGTKSTYINNDITRTPDFYLYENKMSGNMLRLTPALKFSVGKDKLKPYMRLGLVIGLAGKIKSVETYSSNVTPLNLVYVTIAESSMTGGVSLGLSAGLGVNYKLNDKLGIFAEIAFISQSWAPNKSLLTKYTENGVDKLGSMTTNQKETIYLNSYTEVSGANNPSVPAQALKTAMPFSSIGLNIGVQLSIGKSE
jgi:outer membrane protein W